MSSKERCAGCAYAFRENGRVTWCRFHELEVTDHHVCDDFIGLMDTPVMESMLDAEAARHQNKKLKKRTPFSCYIKDIAVYLFVLILTAAAVVAFLFI